MIVDASPLIIFGKLNRVDILLHLYKKIEISEEVYKETILKGLEKKFEDSIILKKHLDQEQIAVVKVKNIHSKLVSELQDINNIDIGEAQTIALAKQLNLKELIIDESLARETARAFGLKPIGSLRVLLIAYKKKLLDEEEVNEIINKMIKLKFRLSAATLLRFWELFDKIK